MNALRHIADDLRDKHLWPVVILLVAALVAVPFIVGRGSSESAEPELSAPPAAGAVANTSPAVVLVGPPAVRSRPGKLRDPFRRAKQAKPAEESSSSSSSSKGSGSETSSDASSGGSKSGSGSSSSSNSNSSDKPKTTTPPKSTPPAPPLETSLASHSVYVTAARFTGGSHDYEHTLSRLAVLGDKDNPAAQYLGVSRGGEYAIFLLGPAATAGGDDGACVVADSCRAIGLRKGDKLQIEVAQATGAPRHYTLEVTSLRRVARASKTLAQRERARVAPGGREALHAFADDVPTRAALSQLLYGPVTGTVALVRSP